jgi:hypothetical protein
MRAAQRAGDLQQPACGSGVHKRPEQAAQVWGRVCVCVRWGHVQAHRFGNRQTGAQRLHT